MPIPLIYPTTLPMIAATSIQSIERRLMDEISARGFQRDRLAVQQIATPWMTAAQAEAWQAWWRDDLVEGGNWFASTWPLPEGGFVTGVRRFLRPPLWEFQAPGYWRVTGECEVRGVGADPVLPPNMIMGLHLNGDLTDEVAANDDAANTPTPGSFLTIAGELPFTGEYFHFATNGSPICSDDFPSPLVLGPEWQVSFWVRPTYNGAFFRSGGMALYMLSRASADSTGFGSGASPPEPTRAQLTVRILGDASNAEVRVQYPSFNPATALYGANTLKPLVNGDPIPVPVDGDFHHIGIVGDSTSTRLYVDFELVADDGDRATGRLPGTRPIWTGTDYINQAVWLGATFSGSSNNDYDLDDHPYGTTSVALSEHFIGDIADVVIWNGTGSATFVGSSFDPIVTRFPDRN